MDESKKSKVDDAVAAEDEQPTNGHTEEQPTAVVEETPAVESTEDLPVSYIFC